MSLTREEKLQPVQHFNMHDDPLTNIETLHLLMWEQGLCIAGYGLDGAVLTAKVYVFPANDIPAVESIFINEPLVAGPQPITHVWIAESRNIVIPQHLFNEEAAIAWLGKFHHISPNETVRTTTVNNAVSIAYPVSNDLVTIWSKYFAEAKIDSISAIILQQKISADSNIAEIVFMQETVALTVWKKGKLMVHQIGLMADVHNLVYKIASICQEYKIAQDNLKVIVSGLCVTEDVTTELKAFFPKLATVGTAQFSIFTLLSKLQACAS